MVVHNLLIRTDFLGVYSLDFHHKLKGDSRDPQQWDPQQWEAGPILFPNPTPIFESLEIWEWYGSRLP